MRLKGKTAFIAGAGRNNGKAIALTFAREGADLFLIAKQRGEELNKVAKQCEQMGVQVHSALGDLSKSEEVNRLAKEGLERFGKVDVLVSATGMRLGKLPWEFTDEEWQQVFAINLHSMFYLARALCPEMIKRGKGGSIMALGGNSTFTAATPSQAALAATKHGLHGLIKALAQALGPHGIRANLLSLANIENERLNPEWYANTGMGGDAAISDDKRATRSPLRRVGKQQEVANAALFLASDESSYITGDRMICAGGIYM